MAQYNHIIFSWSRGFDGISDAPLSSFLGQDHTSLSLVLKVSTGNDTSFLQNLFSRVEGVLGDKPGLRCLSASQLIHNTQQAVAAPIPTASPPPRVAHTPGALAVPSHGMVKIIVVSQDYPWKHLKISPDPIPSRAKNIFHSQGRQTAPSSQKPFRNCLAGYFHWISSVQP